MPTIFWDVDTQYDFIMPDGKLYVTGSERILPNLKSLTDYARREGIRIVGSVDSHAPDDPEISDAPDFQETFPPHCIAGTPGQEKVPETRPADPLWIDSDPRDASDLRRKVESHAGEIIFRKQRFDVFSNPNVDAVLDVLAPDRIVLYGVALDVCNAHAIEGLLERDVAPIDLVLDATRAIAPEKGEQFVDDWKKRGVTVVTTEEITSGTESP